jgi:predicted tellurium resistance membrane protein TerC
MGQYDFSYLATSDAWVSLLMLTFMEIVLGIDNIIFITIVANKLPDDKKPMARNIGLGLAMLLRIGLLFGLSFILQLQHPLLAGKGWGIAGLHFNPTGQSLILLAGGLFLMMKSVSEIHGKLEGDEHEHQVGGARAALAGLGMVVAQIALINIVFSIDSILTAVGLTQNVWVMILGVLVSVVIMMLFAGPIGRYVNDHPTIQMLGLSFLILIGFMLLAEGAAQSGLFGGEEYLAQTGHEMPENAGGHPHKEVVPKGYLYFAIFFSLSVELLNIRLRKRAAPVQLRGVVEEAKEEGMLDE